MSSDPAMGEYLGTNPDELRGQGGVFNPINLQTYHYAGNNPLKYTDPSGREVVIDNDNRDDNQIMLDDINKYSYYTYEFGEDGKTLQKKKDADGNDIINEKGSKAYSRSIDKLITSDRKTTIKYAEGGGGGKVEEVPGKGNKKAGVVITVSKNGYTGDTLQSTDGRTFGGSNSNVDSDMIMDSGQVLIHEIMGHAEPIIDRLDAVDSGWSASEELTKTTNTNAILLENFARIQLGLPLVSGFESAHKDYN